MSWISQNYEKAAVGGGVLIAASLAFLGWSKLNSVDEDFSGTLTGVGNSKTEVRDAELIPLTQESVSRPHAWAQGEVENRTVDLFTSVPLFVLKSDTTKLVDLLKDEAVHPTIPNVWWLEHRIDPGYADSPLRDPDSDGFSNEEEFLSKTDPNNPRSHPELATKLMFVRDDSVQWLLEPGFPADGGFTFKYYDTKNQTNKAGALDIVKPGDLFFKQGAAKERFKMLSSEVRREENPNTHATEERTYVKIEDQRFNKKGKIYDIPNNIPDARKPNYYQFDRAAVLTLEALGQSAKEFKIEENTKFGIPSDNPKKDYLLKKVSPESIEVEYTDAGGSVKTLELRKGARP